MSGVVEEEDFGENGIEVVEEAIGNFDFEEGLFRL